MKKKDKIVTRRVKGSNKSKWMKMTQLPHQKQYFGIGPFISCLVLVQTHTPHTTIYLFIFQFCFHCLWHVLFAKWPKHEWENYEWCVYYSSFVCVYKTYSATTKEAAVCLVIPCICGLCVCENWDTTYNSFYSTFFNINISLSHTLATKDAFNNSIYKPFYFDAYP
jgi:hypothetical protein